MPLIIIAKSSLPPTPTKTMTGILIHPDDVLRVSPPMNSSGDPGVLSAPLSPNRVRQGHSQDMPAEGSLFAVSARYSGIWYASGGGRCAVNRSVGTPAS